MLFGCAGFGDITTENIDVTLVVHRINEHQKYVVARQEFNSGILFAFEAIDSGIGDFLRYFPVFRVKQTIEVFTKGIRIKRFTLRANAHYRVGRFV